MQWLTFNSLDFFCCLYVLCLCLFLVRGEVEGKESFMFLKRCKTASYKLVEGGDATIYDLMLGSPSSLLEEEGNATVY